MQAIIHAQVFDGEKPLPDHAVIIHAHEIVKVLPTEELPGDIEIQCDLGGTHLVPGFIDLQVNGGGGVLFNNTPALAAIRRIAAAHRQYGTTGFLPTLISDSFDVMRCAITAVDQALADGVPGVLGIHLEGPFLNAAKKGAHDADKFCLLDEQGFELVTSLSKGKTLLTLAPELTTPAMIRRLTEAGVIVCAGHSQADYEQTRRALDAGVAGFTHLYNAMTPLHSRAPGMVGAALEDEHSWFGIIADGHHCHPAAFKIAVAAKQPGGALLVTDAMPSVGSSEKSFTLNGERIAVSGGRCVNAAGALAGSDLNMNAAINNAADFAQIDWPEALRMASVYPARALGMDDRLAHIRPGYRADLVALNECHEVTHVWVGGALHET